MFTTKRSLLLLCSALVLAAQSGSFHWTGDMNATRTWHTATLLPNGQVLVAGGRSVRTTGAGTILATAELYDPATGTFLPTGSMHFPRERHSATLLPDGKVLIAGGQSGLAPDTAPPDNPTAELYDPSTGRFTITGLMAFSRYGHAATLLTNGRVLLTGWSAPNAELYDPESGQFAVAGPYWEGGFQCSCAPAALLANGNVLVGGMRFVQLYDPHSDSFTRVGESSDLSMAAVLWGGEVLQVGGQRYQSFFDGDHWVKLGVASLYDPGTNKIRGTDGLRVGRAEHTVTLLHDGSVLVLGGEADWCWSGGCASVGAQSSAETWSPDSGRFVLFEGMRVRRQGHTATLLNDGDVLVTGGAATPSGELFRPTAIRPAANLLSLGGRQAAVLHSGTSSVAGPGNPAAPGDYLEIYWTGFVDRAAVPPQIFIGGRPAEILFFGNAQGYEGLSQANVRMPAGVKPGNDVPLRMTYLSRTSNEVAISVRGER